MNKKAGRPIGTKNRPKLFKGRTLDLRDFTPEPEPKFKITTSQRKLLKEFNPDGLPDFRTKEFKQLSYGEKEDYILEQLAIAIENRKKIAIEEKKKKTDYTEIDVSNFPQYNNETNNKEEEELRSIFYNIYKKYKGFIVIFRYVNNNNILITYELNIPLKNFSRWWKNYSKFGYGIFEGVSDDRFYKPEFITNEFMGKIYIYKVIDKNPIKDEKEFIKQFFKDHPISNCLLHPIKNWAIVCRDEAQSKTTYYRYKKIIEKVDNYIGEYIITGVPQDKIQEISNDIQIDISISLPLNKDKKLLEAKSNKKPLSSFNYINTKFNHIDLNEVLYENNIITKYTVKGDDGFDKEFYIDQNYLRKIKFDMDGTGEFYIYKMNDNKITSIITNQGNYKCFDDFQQTIGLFEMETGLKFCKICDIEDPEISKFVRDSCHYNCSLNFVDDIDKNKEINHIDMEKAYANFKSCSYYDGFLGKITDFRKTNKIMGVGLYQIDNIDFSNCNVKIKKLLLKLNIYHNKYIYTSPELEFLKDNKINFDIIAGCWGHSPFHFDFEFSMGCSKDDGAKVKFNWMLTKKDENGVPYYSKWCGFINSQYLNKNYYLKSSYDYYNVLYNYGNHYDNIRYLEKEQETQITIKKKNNYHLSHINSFITSYQRLNLLEQLLSMNYEDLIRINVDCVYYYGNKEIELKNVFRHKDFKEVMLNDTENSLIPLFENIENYDYSHIKADENYSTKINLGCGGSGKTTKELRDNGLIKKLFCPPSWKLARNKEKEEGVNVSVWYYITTKDTQIRNQILKKYNVLIIDEVSMMTEETKKFILEEFRLCKIIFCGDLGFQLPPINNKEMTTEGIEKIEYFKNNYRCKCPELLELLNKCREMIGDKKSLDFINNYIIKFFKSKKRIINLEKLKEMYDINDMILSGTNRFKDAYSNLFKGKFNDKKFYITSNSRKYSNGEILISKEKPDGVSSDERYCYTTHSIQGETAYDKIFIDISKMFDERMFYTALSRAMYLDQIYLVLAPEIETQAQREIEKMEKEKMEKEKIEKEKIEKEKIALVARGTEKKKASKREEINYKYNDEYYKRGLEVIKQKEEERRIQDLEGYKKLDEYRLLWDKKWRQI